jgi:holo-[acyl-carrier protein] synthase
MVLGVGIDIIEIERIIKSVERYGDRFLDKVYTTNELEYCLSKFNKYQHLAARFSAKEAVYKAVASSWEKRISWQDIEVYNDPYGKPEIKPLGNLKDFLSTDKQLKISMSHSDNYVTCVAIIYKSS